jgi:hypothetical protein
VMSPLLRPTKSTSFLHLPILVSDDATPQYESPSSPLIHISFDTLDNQAPILPTSSQPDPPQHNPPPPPIDNQPPNLLASPLLSCMHRPVQPKSLR